MTERRYRCGWWRGVWAALGLSLATGCARPPAPPPGWVEQVLTTLDLPARAAQLLVVPLDAGSDMTGGAVLRLPPGLRPGGVSVVGGTPLDVAELVRALEQSAAVPLLVTADVDGGVASSVQGGTGFPPAQALAVLASPEAAREAGWHTAREARALGIDLGWVRLPPLTGSGDAALFARDPERAATGLAAYLEGAREAGLEIGVQALWAGSGEAGMLAWDRARLEAVELALLRGTLARGSAALWLGDARVPSLSGDSLPLSASRAGVHGLLRRELGWRGVVAAEVGVASTLARAYGSEEAAVRALAAGADLLLGVRDPERVVAAIVDAVRSGRLPAERVDSAVARVLALKLRVRSARRLPAVAPDSLEPHLRAPAAVWLAERLTGEAMARFASPAGAATIPPPPAAVLVLRPLARGRVLVDELQNARPGVRELALNLTADSAALVRALGEAMRGAQQLLLLEFPGDAGPALHDLVVAASAGNGEGEPRVHRVVFAPLTVSALPGAAGLVVWGTGAEAQRAAARGLLQSDILPPPDPRLLRWPPAPVLRTVKPAAVGMSEAGLQRVDEAIRAAIAEGVTPGAALAVGRRGGLVRLRGYGRTGQRGAAVHAESTLYDIASLTKVVATTSAVAMLADAERLRVDAPLERYLAEFRPEDGERVTVRHLLTHTSGLPSGLWLYGSASSPRDALRRVLRQPLRRAPGESVEYSDLGFILLAEAAERAAGMPLDRFLARDLFAPLGMAHTMFLPPLWLRERTVPTALRTERGFVLRGVVHDANAFRLGGVAGHAGLFSTARDLAVFAQMVLNGGSYGTARVLAPEVVERFTTRQPGAGTRALGWDTPASRSSAGRYFSSRSFGHTGYTGTSLWIDPERELFVVLLTNRTYAEASSGDMLRLRQAVHEAVARAVEDTPTTRRPGAR